MDSKSSVEQIRARFDADVDRFSDLAAGQLTAMDSALCLDLIAQGAAAVTPGATTLLDVGCGAGNWTLRLLEVLPKLDVTLMDLSQPMLDRAIARVTAAGATSITIQQCDVRGCRFEPGSFDLIVAGSVLHHLREEDEWRAVFKNFHRWLRPGGSVWVYDLVTHEHPVVEQRMAERYATYLKTLGGEELARKVFDYVAEEDSPRPVTWQLERMREAGFATVDILHKTATFAAYTAVR
ncbi:MAG: methyltransferase domain-containing protein [Burkholderiales bacterium]|nr:methyltransferase domain-containing protein [Phycisphaerae bacterium]